VHHHTDLPSRLHYSPFPSLLAVSATRCPPPPLLFVSPLPSLSPSSSTSHSEACDPSHVAHAHLAVNNSVHVQSLDLTLSPSCIAGLQGHRSLHALSLCSSASVTLVTLVELQTLVRRSSTCLCVNSPSALLLSNLSPTGFRSIYHLAPLCPRPFRPVYIWSSPRNHINNTATAIRRQPETSPTATHVHSLHSHPAYPIVPSFCTRLTLLETSIPTFPPASPAPSHCRCHA
jgi:hypothetical protein